MIRLPPGMSPSELLAMEDVSPFVVRLLEVSRSFRLQGSWDQAEQQARDALEGSQQPGAQVSRGAALVHLADIHLATGRTGISLRETRRAYQLFAAQPSRTQRHNEAVAAYAAGLAHQTLGSRVEALKWYEKSNQLLERVKIEWSARNARSDFDCCSRLQRWIAALGDCLTDEEMLAPAQDQTTVWLPVVLSETESRFALARLTVERYLIAGTLDLGGRAFRVELLDAAMRPSLRAEADYYALRIPKEALELFEADNGDYALVVRHHQADHAGPGVLETGDGLQFGAFERDESGQIRFNSSEPTVIGSDVAEAPAPVGYVTALLRRKDP